MDGIARAVALGKRVWPHLVAAFVVYWVAGACADVVPDVGLGMNRRAWREPRVRDELTRWAERLDMKRTDLEDDLFALGQGMVKARSLVNRPFRVFQRVTGVRQSWAMFVAGTRYRDRFQVRARACNPGDASCDWEILYENADPAHAWKREILEHARVRSAVFRWGWPQLKHTYERGCRSVAKLAFEERSELVAVECRFERSLSPPGRSSPAARAEAPAWGREQLVLRDDVAPAAATEGAP